MLKPRIIGTATIHVPLDVELDGVTMRVLPGEYPAFRMPGYNGVYLQLHGQARAAGWEGRTTLNYFVQDGDDHANGMPGVTIAA